MNPRAPLAGSVVCLGNSNRAFGVLSGPEVTTRGHTNVWMPTAYIFSRWGFEAFVVTSGPESTVDRSLVL